MTKIFSIVGSFIKSKRVEARLSQKELGQKLEPQVTTQFISNIERGATPLPSDHITRLCRELKIREEDLISIMEQEYAQKLRHQVGIPTLGGSGDGLLPIWWNDLTQSYLNAPPDVKEEFQGACERVFPSIKTSL